MSGVAGGNTLYRSDLLPLIITTLTPPEKWAVTGIRSHTSLVVSTNNQ